ncbi:hypothetical protein SS50377_20060 [Spironucleus salmonicida]|uniref:Uncharacterized protein n=1 Tax=Spironucleus salmonicida TaxID=348837 RepID=V6M022_9EUKA|nr:hypothetical protein SS50377_20060 [Spironucleus salmonicida]|eukprot:EST49371.1 Hypothetical protein SS50377_10296 [Spironucleus salmonicida]
MSESQKRFIQALQPRQEVKVLFNSNQQLMNNSLYPNKQTLCKKQEKTNNQLSDISQAFRYINNPQKIVKIKSKIDVKNSISPGPSDYHLQLDVNKPGYIFNRSNSIALKPDRRNIYVNNNTFNKIASRLHASDRFYSNPLVKWVQDIQKPHIQKKKSQILYESMVE